MDSQMDSQSNGKRGDSLTTSLLTNENLLYKLPMNSSVVSEKTSKDHFSDKTTYTAASDRISFVLNSGSDFINAANSYLRLNVKATGTGNGTSDLTSLTFGSGSACNLISEIIIRTRDSVEIERIRNVNSLIATQLKWMYSKDYNDKTATMAGVGAWNEIQPVGLSPAGESTPNYATYIIPLKWLAGLFNTDSLLPSFLMAGLRIELVLAPAATVFVTNTNSTATGYTITDPVIRLETCRLMDGIMNALTERAATDGLVIPISTWDLTNTSVTASKVNLEVRRNISQCLGCVVKSRLTADLTDATADSVNGEANHDIASYRFRLGSLFIPSAAIDNKTEHFALAQIAYDKFKMTSAENAVSYNDYMTGGRAIIATDLERSAIDLSGQSISNSKLLAFEATYGAANPRSVDIYVNFTRVITSFLANTLVEE